MEYHIVPLRNILDMMDEGSLNSFLRRYKCERDSERMNYLHNKAVVMEKKQISRTYIAINSNKMILGYFSVGMKCMRIPKDTPISKTTRRKMNIDENTNVAQSYLIGQLGRDDDANRGFGKILLQEAIRIISQANELVGCQMIRLDCSDDLLKYYEDNGFIFVSKNESENLNQMAILI